MATDSQKSMKDLEQQDQIFIKEFSGIDKKNPLELYERAHQKQIMESSIYVRDAFDRHWKTVTGNFYFSPITLRSKAEDGTLGGTLHPKTVKYRVKRTFVSLRWKKNLHEVPIRSGETRKIISFDAFGTMENGQEVAIERNVEPNALIAILGENLTQQVTQAGKTKFEGVIDLQPPQEIPIIGYWEVIFSPGSNREDPEDVTLTHNGNCLQIKRNEKVVLPGYYLEIADNGTFPKYIQTPEQSRKIVGWMQFFPYTVLREATEGEYVRQKKEGDRLTAEARRRETEIV